MGSQALEDVLLSNGRRSNLLAEANNCKTRNWFSTISDGPNVQGPLNVNTTHARSWVANCLSLCDTYVHPDSEYGYPHIAVTVSDLQGYSCYLLAGHPFCSP